MAVNKVNCTHCGEPVAIFMLKYQTHTQQYPEGSYEGTCTKCGAIFEYDAYYIKQLLKQKKIDDQ